MPHISDDKISGFFSPPEQPIGVPQDALALSGALITELKSADIVAIPVLIYNFSIPSALKAWIDQITTRRAPFG